MSFLSTIHRSISSRVLLFQTRGYARRSIIPIKSSVKIHFSTISYRNNSRGTLLSSHQPFRAFTLGTTLNDRAQQPLPKPDILSSEASVNSQPFSMPTGTAPGKMDDKLIAHHCVPLNQTFANLECDIAFSNLKAEEKLYAHYLAKACWEGGLITLVQTSPESPLIFSILHNLFHTNGVDGLKTIATKVGYSEDDWKAFILYASAIFTNSGNYKSFGDTKIVPNLPVEKFEELVKNAKYAHYKSEDWLARWNYVRERIYSLSGREAQLGLGDDGITMYFSDNCTTKDAELVNRFMLKHKKENYITRVFKTVEGPKVKYEIRHASVAEKGVKLSEDFEDCHVTFTYGDYSPLLKKTCDNLHLAMKHASNETEKSMIQNYIKSFTEGSLDAHKDGSRFWIKDKGPAIETYIGFIETYRDPAGTRGEFEGFVSMVNRPMSVKFQTLVDKAPGFLKMLPWPKEFERETFIKPDFTSLDVLAFSGSGIPAGINIPNYDEIRQNEGFKNVSLGNVIPASYKNSTLHFLNQADQDLLNKHQIPGFEIQVGLHELIGHGSGKLFMKTAPDVKNPLNGGIIESVYAEGETYDSVFGALGSSYEECRAESVAIFLALEKEALKIFGYEGPEAEDILYVIWLKMAYAGVKALEMYQPQKKAWMQAHSQARFVILQVLLEAGQGFVTVEEKTGADGKPDLLITMDRSKISTVGKKAMHDFLLKLQVYKATADIKNATKMYDHYSEVSTEGIHPWATWRDIVLAKKEPRKFFVQPNTFLDGKGGVEMKTYPATPEGLAQSWIDRFPEKGLYADIDFCWKQNKNHY